MPWYVKGAKKVIGPLSSSDLQSLAGAGRLTAAHLVSTAVDGPWVIAGSVKGLVFGRAKDAAPQAAAKVAAPPPPARNADHDLISDGHCSPPPLPSSTDLRAIADSREALTDDQHGMSSQPDSHPPPAHSIAKPPPDKLKALVVWACNQISKPGRARVGVIVVCAICVLLVVIKRQYNLANAQLREHVQQRYENYLADSLDYIEQAASRRSDSRDLIDKSVNTLSEASREANRLADWSLENPALYWVNCLEVMMVPRRDRSPMVGLTSLPPPIAAYRSDALVTAGYRSLVLEREGPLSYWRTGSKGDYRDRAFSRLYEDFTRKNVAYFKRITALLIRICELKLKAGETPKEIQESITEGMRNIYYDDIEAPFHLEIAIARSDRKFDEFLFYMICEPLVEDIDGHPLTEKERFRAISHSIRVRFKSFMEQLLQQ